MPVDPDQRVFFCAIFFEVTVAERIGSVEWACERLNSAHGEIDHLTRHNLRYALESGSSQYLAFVLRVMDVNARLFITAELLKKKSSQGE